MSDAARTPRPSLRESDLNISRPLIYFSLLASSAAWYLQLLLKYAFTSHSCYPGSSPVTGLQAQNLGWLEPLQYGIDAAALAVAVIAAIVSYRDWRVISAQAGIEDSAPTSIIQGASRYLSLWGLAYACLFGVAIIFDFIFAGVLRPCG
jgi:hypothetical protein